MTLFSRLLPLAALTLLTACAAEKPFILTDYRYHQRGIIMACYNEENGTLAEAKALADEICRPYDRVSKIQLVQENQCTWSAPTQVLLSCVPRAGENPDPILLHNAPMRHDTPLPPW